MIKIHNFIPTNHKTHRSTYYEKQLSECYFLHVENVPYIDLIETDVNEMKLKQQKYFSYEISKFLFKKHA